MKILHTADWHIGSFKGPEEDGVNLRSVDTLKCLDHLVSIARMEHPQLVLVSGDIFHQAEIWQGRSHKEVLQARSYILELSKAADMVVVMRGTPNHDSQEAFDELTAHFELVNNVKIVTQPEVVRTPFADIAVVPGFDKGQFRAKFPGLSKEEENVLFSDELGNIVVGLRAMCSSGLPAILMSHYTVPGCNTESGQTQFLTQFEPVITQEMLVSADYDFVALGHIHRPQQITGLKNVYYSGAVNAMNFNDEGQDRGFWMHLFEHDVVRNSYYYQTSTFYRTPYRQFQTIDWTSSEVDQAITNSELLTLQLAQYEVAHKIVRIRYSCTAEQKKVFNTALIEKALYANGAFYVADISMEKLENANRTELSKYDNPETNLVQYLTEKLIEPSKIDAIVEKARPIIARAMANESVSEFFGTFVPKEIEVKNYRSYVEQSFSFEDITFCTINGVNGAGKSSLFMDAIIDCLYEEPRDGSNTGWIRNDEKARSGYIAFTFSLGEHVFRVVRTRAKSGKGTLNLAEMVNGEWIDRSKEKYKDTQAEIERVIGMDSLTFRACVIIMQDQYGLFLEAGKEERVGVLSNLLGLGVYGIMEDLTRLQLSDLKRDIAKKNQTINIHTSTVEGYGNPEEEMQSVKEQLIVHQQKIAELTKEKEEKSLLLRMQQEAAERRNRVLSSVNSLTQKKAATEQNINLLSNTINSCECSLLSEAETLEKVERYHELVEKDKEVAATAAVCQTQSEELLRTKEAVKREESVISSYEANLNRQNDEIEVISSAADDEEIRSKEAEYQHQLKVLDEAYGKERQYRDLEQKLSNARYERSGVVSMLESKRSFIVQRRENYEAKAKLLDGVDCVDINNAHCGFLSDAIEAKKALEELPQRLADIESKIAEDRKPFDETIASTEQQMSALNFDEGAVRQIQAKVAELKPYVAKLEELNQRESRIALIRASIEHIKSNILEAEKRLAEVKLKASQIESAMPAYLEAAQNHKALTEEISSLKKYVDIAASFPVIKERMQNAQKQQADEVIRLSEIEKELSEAVAELEKTSGATMDTEDIKKHLGLLDFEISNINKVITSGQQTIGSLQQKIGEIEKLQSEIRVLKKDALLISADIGQYDLLKTAFSQDGIPHQIIRALVPKLTEISTNILGQMTGGKMGIEFQTEKVMKSNSDKEVVTLDIYIEEYGKSVLPYLSKSGGEKVKASLSVILALAEIKSSSAGIQLGMLFIDEPPFLDGDGIQAYCDALETIQNRYKNLKIMAITHDPTMKARFAQNVDVIKTDEGSKVIY